MTDSVIIEEERDRRRDAVTFFVRMKRYFTADMEARVRSMYELNDRKITGRSLYRDFLAIKTLYLNYGYWQSGCADQDEASQVLVDMLGDAAGMGPGDRVLDAGFGYGEQDIRWATTRGPLHIHGLNVTHAQVAKARARIADAGLADAVDLRIGSATAVPFDNASFERVVALESALHFNTRQRFFEEAARVLVPGGVLATADIVPTRTSAGLRGPIGRLERWVRDKVVPSDNWYTMAEYRRRLERAGFVDVDVRPITDHVIAPRVAFYRSRFDAPENRGLSLLDRTKMRLFVWVAEQRVGTREYILAVARKPTV